MEFKCGACGRMIFNRRLAACEFCNAPIPQELLYTEEERQRIDREVKEEIRRQFAERQKEREKGQKPEDEKEQEEKKKAAKRSDPTIEQLLALASARDNAKGGEQK
jgi:hypothetical protein